MNAETLAIGTSLLSWRHRIGEYLELTKPRLSALVLVTTAVGFWMGLRMTESLSRLFPLLIGTSLVVGGANALNEWIERVPDGLMRRTQHRPLPSGRITPAAALRFGLWTSVAGLMVLALMVNTMSAMLAALSWISYVLIYTPLKSRTPLCTLVGAIPGALPPMIGWVGASETLDFRAWALVTILFLWQLPHFLALAVVYREDYTRAGFQMLPLMEPDGLMTARQTVLYGLVLLPVSLVPALIGLGGPRYFYGALICSLVFLSMAVQAARIRSAQSAQRLFLASVLYLPLLLGWLACDRGRF